MKDELHPSHDLRYSDASSYDFVCKKCNLIAYEDLENEKKVEKKEE
jgi:hypothetical protein